MFINKHRPQYGRPGLFEVGRRGRAGLNVSFLRTVGVFPVDRTCNGHYKPFIDTENEENDGFFLAFLHPCISFESVPPRTCPVRWAADRTCPSFLSTFRVRAILNFINSHDQKQH